MRNVTVTLDDETARWARLEAARRDISVSSLIRQLLTEHMGGREGYEGAKGRYLARTAAVISSGGELPLREEMHDRVGLR